MPLEGPAIVRRGAAKPATPPAPANDDRKSAIVTARRPRARSSVEVSGMTPEEHRRRGEAAAALWRELVRRVTGKP